MDTKPAERVRVGNVIVDMHGRKWCVIDRAPVRTTLAPYALRLPRINLTVRAVFEASITEVWQVAPGDLLPMY